MGTKVFVFRLLLILYTCVDEEGLQIRALLLGEMEIIVGRILVRLESWFSRDWVSLGTEPNYYITNKLCSKSKYYC